MNGERIELRFTASKLQQVDVTIRKGDVPSGLYSSLARVVGIEPTLSTSLLVDTGES